MRKVLFVCIENSCRSQVAEGFARSLGAGVLEAHSAGSKPSGRVNPAAVSLMRKRGVDISGQRSKGLREVPALGWDYVVTMGCGDACPYVPGKARLDWDIPDPKSMPEAEFDKVLDDVEGRVRALIDENRRP